MRQSNRELWLSFTAILVVTLGYLAVVIWLGGVPAAADFFGHSLGIIGFLMMLMTETLYTLRKRRRSAVWGRMSTWLEFHIFTGLVGPYMVLLHASWKYNGLAGLTLLLTAVVVASGFVGRYIYTAVPRTVDGVEVQAELLQQEIVAAQIAIEKLLALQTSNPRMHQLAGQLTRLAELPKGGMAFLLERGLWAWRFRWEWGNLRRQLKGKARQQAEQLEELIWRRQVLRGQLSSLATARRTLAIWHAIHIPIGMVLFLAAFIHIIAAIYYATLLRLWD